MEKQENIIYLYYKVVEELVFCNNFGKLIESIEKFIVLDSISILEILEQFLKIYNNYMTSDMKKNAYTLIDIFINRLDITSEEEKKDMINKKNKLISMVNSSSGNKIEEMLRSELDTRLMDKKLTKKSMKNINTTIAAVKAFIINDLNILITHSSIYDDDTFMLCHGEYVKSNLDYMACINAIAQECPSMFSEDLFRNRVSIVLKEIKKSIRFGNKVEKKIYVNINKNLESI